MMAELRLHSILGATVSSWPIMFVLAAGLVAIYLLAPRARPMGRLPAAVLAAVALVFGGWHLIWREGASVELVLFYCFSGIAVIAGAALITQTNPVHAALSFALVVLSTCGLFLLQAAPFLMAATTIVYAGAIVVTFLFVIMLAQQDGFSRADQLSREPLLATVASFVLLGAFVILIDRTLDLRSLGALGDQATLAASLNDEARIEETLGDPDEFFGRLQAEADRVRGAVDHNRFKEEILEARANWGGWQQNHQLAAMQASLAQLGGSATYMSRNAGLLQPAALPDDPQASDVGQTGTSVAALGGTLFTKFLIPVELAGTVLLAATIGAIAITSRRPEAKR